MTAAILLLLLLFATSASADRIFIYGFEGNHTPTADFDKSVLQEYVFSNVVGTPTIVQDTMAGTTDNTFALELNPAASTKEYVEVEVPEGNIWSLHVTMKITDNPRSGTASRRRIVAEGRRDVQSTLITEDDFLSSGVELSTHGTHSGAHFPTSSYWSKKRGYENDVRDDSTASLDADGGDDVTCSTGTSVEDGMFYVADVTHPRNDYYAQANIGTPATHGISDARPMWMGVRVTSATEGFFLRLGDLDDQDDGIDGELYKLVSNTFTLLSGAELDDAFTENTVIRLSVATNDDSGDEELWITENKIEIGSRYDASAITGIGQAGLGIGNLQGNANDCSAANEWDDWESRTIEPDEPTFLVTYTPVFQNAIISPGVFELYWANRRRECFFSKYDGTDCEDDITNCVDASIFGDQFCDEAIFGKSVVLALGSVNQLLITEEAGVDLDATRPHDVRIGLWVNGRERGTSIRPQGVCSGLAADESVARACGADADCDQEAPADTCSSTTVNKTGRILIGGTENTIDGAMTLRIDDIVIADHIDLDMAFLRLQDLKITGTCDPRDWSERSGMTNADHGAGLDRLGVAQTFATDGDGTWMESSIIGTVDDLCTLSNITLFDGVACSGSPATCQSGVNNGIQCTPAQAAKDCDEFIDPNAGFALLAVAKRDGLNPSGFKLTLKDGTAGGVDGPTFTATQVDNMSDDVWELIYGGTFIADGQGAKWDSGASPETQMNNARIELNSTNSLTDLGISEAYAVAEISMPRPPIIPHLADQDGDGEICVLIVGDSRLADWAATGALLGEVEQITTLRHVIGPGQREQHIEENFLAMLRGQAWTSQYNSGNEIRAVTLTGSPTAKVDYVIFDVSADYLLQNIGAGIPKGFRGYCHMKDANDPSHGNNCSGHPDGYPPENLSEVFTNWITTHYCVRGSEHGQECLTVANPTCDAPSGWAQEDPNSCIDGITDPNDMVLCRPGILGDRDCIGGVCYQPPSLGWNAAVLHSLLDQAADANSVPIVLANSGTVERPRKWVGTYDEYAANFTCMIDPNHQMGDYSIRQAFMAWDVAGARGVNRINMFLERQARCGKGKHQGCIRDFVHPCTSRRSECKEENWPTSPSATDTLEKYLARGLGNCCRFNPDGDEPLPNEIDLDIISACLKGDSAAGGAGLFPNADCTIEITNP